MNQYYAHMMSSAARSNTFAASATPNHKDPNMESLAYTDSLARASYQGFLMESQNNRATINQSPAPLNMNNSWFSPAAQDNSVF